MISKISVILPCYKHKAYLMDAVQSIINQTHTDWELLIFNDDPDDTLLYQLLDDRIKVIECSERLGQAARLNQGIDLATGEYIAFQDADDISIPQRFRLSLKYIIDFLYGDGICLSRANKLYIKATDNFDLHLTDASTIACPFDSILIKTELAKKVRFNESIGFGNDRIWYLDIIKQRPEITYLPLPLVFVNNDTSNFRINSKNKLQTIKARIHRKFIRNKLTKQINENIAGIS